MPDARSGETVDHADAQLRCAARAAFFMSSAARVFTPAGSPSPQMYGGQDRLVPGIDVVQDRLARQVIADREHLHAVFLQRLPLAIAVARIGHRLGDLEVVARAGQFEAVEAEVLGLDGQCLQRQIGPLAGTQRDRSRHVGVLL